MIVTIWLNEKSERTMPQIEEDVPFPFAIGGYKGAMREYPIAPRRLIKHKKYCTFFILSNNILLRNTLLKY